jgi:hypothetical protein
VIKVKIQEIVGKNIKKYRLQKKLTQEELAEICDLHRTYISSIERGVKSPSLNILFRISNELEINIKNLFE